eukprot:SAG22_NODE_463_length_10196_cov_4.491928_7_plen_290_part_00
MGEAEGGSKHGNGPRAGRPPTHGGVSLRPLWAQVWSAAQVGSAAGGDGGWHLSPLQTQSRPSDQRQSSRMVMSLHGCGGGGGGGTEQRPAVAFHVQRRCCSLSSAATQAVWFCRLVHGDGGGAGAGLPWMQLPPSSCVTAHADSPRGFSANTWLGFPVHGLTTTVSPPLLVRHAPSITDVMVPLGFRLHAPLQSHGDLQDLGKPLHPQLQFTAAPAFVSHASISQHPPFGAAILRLVAAESPGLTPGDSCHSCSTTPSWHFLRAKPRAAPTAIMAAARMRSAAVAMAGK